jgi:hypothetical protein
MVRRDLHNDGSGQVIVVAAQFFDSFFQASLCSKQGPSYSDGFIGVVF